MRAAPALVHAEKGALRCLACGHRCLIREGRAGVCKVRFNHGGELRVPAGYVAGVQVDPIEKKPFYHAYPGRNALSFGMLGCDLHCGYCQNWVTSQALRDDEAVALPRFVEPDELAELAVREGAPVVVSTYNEPLITADWAVEVFKVARERGRVCGFVSNGNATPEVLEFLRPYVSLYKVDLKAFNERAYRELGCTLKNVLETIGRLVSMGFWVELVTLVVPGLNDDPKELRGMAEFIAGISPDIPWHVTAFHPDYKMRDRNGTSLDAIDIAYEAGKTAGLHFVYPGNVHGRVGEREHTCCPGCGSVLIRRRGFHVLENRMQGDTCPDCGRSVPGVWEAEPPRQGDGDGLPRPLFL
ncbi:MAG: AmmeMemoRadiSam system radical SAM enzyme [Candidatus Hydrogenedens sp.]|nr:AmmeMemoRadiSam system radical SAM enzyme [Candidatus Hydrogenedens sp.]